MNIKITSISGAIRYIYLANLSCIGIESTTISFCTGEAISDKLVYTRGTDLTNANFDLLKEWLNANIPYLNSI